MIFQCRIIVFLLIFISLTSPQQFNIGKLNHFKFLKSVLDGPNPEIAEEALSEPTYLINKYGYPAENHTVQTDDNYFLMIQRIPHGKTDGLVNQTRIPVLLMHGMNCESTQWFDSGPQSLAFVLADEGYDVWMGNFRGGSYTNHSTYSRDKVEFWDYSFENHALQDLPTIIEYVLTTTGYSKLFYIGQSMGTTAMFILLSEKPEYNDNLAAFIALTPVAHGRYVTALVRPLTHHLKFLTTLNNLIGRRSFMATSPSSRKTTLRFCPSSNPFLCEFGMPLTAGFDPYLHNTSRIPIYAIHCSVGASTKTFLHFAQFINGKKPRKFNYGPEQNIARYGSADPPEFNISRVTAPTVIFYCANDASATPLDVALIKRQLPNVVGYELFPDPMAVHTDIAWAMNAKEVVFDKIVDYLKKLWNGTDSAQ